MGLPFERHFLAWVSSVLAKSQPDFVTAVYLMSRVVLSVVLAFNDERNDEVVGTVCRSVRMRAAIYLMFFLSCAPARQGHSVVVPCLSFGAVCNTS